MSNKFPAGIYQIILKKLSLIGTKMRYYYRLVLAGIRVIRNEGWRSFFKKTKGWLEHRFFPLDAVPRTFRYYKGHGLRQTVAAVRYELSKKGTVAKDIIELYAPSTLKEPTTALRKVSFVPGDLIRDPYSQSSRYRVFNIIEGLTAKGIQCNVFYEIEQKNREELLTSDLVVIFRAAMSENIDAIITTFKQHSIPTVFDIDDLIFEPESTRFIDAIKNWTDAQRYDYAMEHRKTLEKCDFATCTTSYMVDRVRAAGKRIFVIPNTINKAQYEVAEKILKTHTGKDKGIVRISYFSGTMTHNRDFLEAEDAMLEILKRHKNVEFHVVGELELSPKFDVFGERVIRTALMPHLEMLKYMAKMDINIAPLEQNNPFTAAKSELKIFEPALVRLPTVASRTDSHSRCISDGINGFLAGAKKEWIEKLSLLVKNRELRTSMGSKAREDFVARHYIENVADSVIKIYEDITNAYHREKSVDLEHIDIAWIIPEPFEGSGGHRNIFRAVKKLSEYGHKLTVYSLGYSDGESVRRIVNNHFCKLSHDVKFIKYSGNLRYHDVCFATMWTTVYTMMRHKEKIKHMFYFVQDYEPMFYSMGADYLLAENTYKMGLNIITSGPWPARVLKNKFNLEAEFFRFPVDKNVYNKKVKRTKETKTIVFLARPEMPRRCYEIGLTALKLVKEKMPDIEIILFGSDNVSSRSVPFEHTNLGLIRNINELAKLYRNADLGIAFSTTNPSLIPYEMIACGLAVGDLRMEDAIANYEREENVYLLDPLPETMAREIVDIMRDDDGRKQRASNGYNFVQGFPDEEGMCRRIEEFIKKKIKER